MGGGGGRGLLSRWDNEVESPHSTAGLDGEEGGGVIIIKLISSH